VRHLGVSFPVLLAVVEDELWKFAYAFDSEVAASRRVSVLTILNTDAHVGLLDHVDIVGTVANRAREQTILHQEVCQLSLEFRVSSGR
jgi:hypothetical protein